MNRSMLALLLIPLSAVTLAGQDIRQADSLYRAGQGALESGDTAAYQRNADSAARMMPAGNLNRPFVQYHAARANALMGQAEQASDWLTRMLDEEIEGLMVWYSTVDAGFDRVRSSPSYQEIVRRTGSIRLRSTPLGHGLIFLEGAGGNVLLAPAAEGVLLVDVGYAPGGSAITRALPTHAELRWIVLTHAHEDHIGGLRTLVERDGAPVFTHRPVVLAHPAAVTALQSPQEFIAGVNAPALALAESIEPVVASRAIKLRDGDSALVIPLPAHTGGDLLVWFPGARVLAIGDNYLPGANPFLELGGIQDIQGYLASMGELIARLHPDTKVVPGHGSVATLEDLRAIHGKTRDGVEFVRARKSAGVSLVEIKTEGASRGLPGPWIERAYRRIPSP